MGKIAVIICAAGSGRRFGGKRNKIFAEVAGRAAVLRSVELFAGRADVKQIILAVGEEDKEMVELKFGPVLGFHGVKVCLGGKERHQTVANALERVDKDIELVAVHDAARCCVQDKWIDEVFAAAAKSKAAILAAPVVATLKKVKEGKIVQTVERDELYEAQTPQVFQKELLERAYGQADKMAGKITDDAQLVEALGHEVSIVPGDATNLKITTQADVMLAEAVIKASQKKPARPLGAFEEMQW